MKTITAHKAVRHFSALVDEARAAPVAVTRHKRTVAVVISPSDYRDFARLKDEALRSEVAQALADIENAPANDDKAVRVLARLMKRAGR
ncbi:type II toxin-antitoxin system Phd/YefM family antitoxin [Hyphococcus luteus]|uniref:Antitoxin n=1 Tax=Hyphococcus luteus TaxID=2058213 RepID=A0A2S7JZB3_9PROT|nr:type II toxin-antitoxin system Phd/YefM family antitoxin [Marinicaulis flavus]PQA85580.1 hypothetical protein CW354_21835 [Marinicaulis flavus]